jgi:mannose-6-phosphate isomerase-like protein (cupin superfamily)
MELRVERSGLEGGRQLEEYLRRLGCSSVVPWADPAGRLYAPHTHDHDEILAVVRGRLDFQAGGRTWVLQAGDILHLPAGTVHTASVPEPGVEFLIGSIHGGVPRQRRP